MPRTLATLAAVLTLPLLLSVGASATPSIKFKKCLDSGEFSCGRITVPIDYAGREPGTFSLKVKKLTIKKPKGAIFAFAGGPGQAATPLGADFQTTFAAPLKTRDLVVFDQRGTGASSALDCSEVTDAEGDELAGAISTCVQRLGSRSAYYTTRDSVEDIEQIRQALGYDKITLYGVSYGTKVAEAYALKYPEHVERMIIDSVVLPEGPDMLYRSTSTATRRVLNAICARKLCTGVTKVPVDDLAALVSQISSKPLQGQLVDGYGKKKIESLTSSDLFGLLLNGDFDPISRRKLSVAVKAAVRGDVAPILRLANPGGPETDYETDPNELSDGLFTATTCEESTFPWPRTLPNAERLAYARSELEKLDSSSFAPFDRSAVLGGEELKICQHWPTATSEPTLSGSQLPNVPTLILSGSEDLRTPLEDAQILAARVPGAQLVKVSGVGHSVLGSDVSGCAIKAVEQFFKTDRVQSNCGSVKDPFERVELLEEQIPPFPGFIAYKVPPTQLNSLKPIRGVPGIYGRTLEAVELTLKDMNDAMDQVFVDLLLSDVSDSSPQRIGGLRGGSIALYPRSLRFRVRGYEYVSGVTVSGLLDDSEDFTVRVGGSAAAKGTLHFTAHRITGRLGGKRIKVSFTKQEIREVRRLKRQEEKILNDVFDKLLEQLAGSSAGGTEESVARLLDASGASALRARVARSLLIPLPR